jgi:hypothetical protein
MVTATALLSAYPGCLSASQALGERGQLEMQGNNYLTSKKSATSPLPRLSRLSATKQLLSNQIPIRRQTYYKITAPHFVEKKHTVFPIEPFNISCCYTILSFLMI